MDKKLLVHADHINEFGEPVVVLRYIDKNGDSGIDKVREFKPYFYIPESESNQWNKKEVFQTIKNEKVARYYVNNPSDVKEKRSSFTKHWESDVPYPLRFLIDKEIYSGYNLNSDNSIETYDVKTDEIVPSQLYFDIETQVIEDEVEMDPSKSNSRIISIVCRYINPNKGIHEECTIHDKNEKKMLDEFINYVRDRNPDILLAWFIYFDIGTIFYRCKHHNLDIRRISPVKQVYIKKDHKGNKKLICKGRLVIDLMEAYDQYYTNINLESKGLEDVAFNEVGIEHSDFDYSKMIDGNWQKHIDEIIKYNKLDVERMVKLNEKLNIVKHFEELRRTCGCFFEQAYRTTGYVDIMFLREYHNKYVLPNKRKKKHVKFKGGMVEKMSPPGVYEWVAVLDFSAHYPTGVKTFNISPETMTDDTRNAYKIETDIGDVWFKKEPKGILPQVFEKMEYHRNILKEERDKYNKDDPMWAFYENRQYVRKQIINAIYGYFVYVGSRLYIPELGASVTAVGRRFIKDTIKFVEDNYEVETHYVDTDSIMFSLKPSDIDEAIKISMDVTNDINQFWEEVSIEEELYGRPDIECEKIFRRMFFTEAKKKYCGWKIWEKGKKCDELSVTGFEIIRTDESKPTKEIQENLLRTILIKNDLSEIGTLIKDVEKKLRNSTDIKYIGQPKMIRRKPDSFVVPMSIHGVLWSNENLGKKFGISKTRCYLIYVKRTPPEYNASIFLPKRLGEEPEMRIINRIALDEDDDIDKWLPYINRDTHIEKQVHEKIKHILNGIGMTYSEAKNGHEQTKLF